MQQRSGAFGKGVDRMYRNIILDLGGVVVEFSPRDFLMDRFINKKTEELVYDLTFGSKVWAELERGALDREQANKSMLAQAAACGRTFEVRTVLEEWEGILRTKRPTVKTMCRLKLAGYRLYYLSNIAADTLEHLKRRDFFPLFDGGVASCEVGLCKPDPQIYTLLMQRYGLAYDETIFVDDTKANAQAAYDLGITGILYKNRASFVRALTTCGIQLSNTDAKPKP